MRATPGRLHVPAIFVPGVLGTTLVDPAHHDFPAWGSARGLLFPSRRHEDLDLPLLPGQTSRLRPGEVLWTFELIPHLFGLPIYQPLARRLARAGIPLGHLGEPGRDAALYGLICDWRHGIVTGARALEQAVEAVCAAAGVPRVHLVGHSWGSAVIRYFLRYGGADVLGDPPEAPRPGAPRIATFVAAGAPYAGSLVALHELNNGFAPGGPIGRKVMPYHMASAPVAYELLPYDQGLFVDRRGDALGLDLADAGTWAELAWGPFAPESFRALLRRARGRDRSLDAESFSAIVARFLAACLARGRRLWALLEHPMPLDRDVHTVTYASRNSTTIARVAVDWQAESGGARPRRTYSTIRMLEALDPALAARSIAPGDTYVPFERVLSTVGDPVVRAGEDVASTGSVVVDIASPGHRALPRQAALLDDLVARLAARAASCG